MHNQFKRHQLSIAVAAIVSTAFAAWPVWAGPGFVDAQTSNGVPFRLQTYFANSPAGPRTTPVQEAASQDTGVALRKFVDPLPLIGAANARALLDGTMKYIPQAVTGKWVNPQGVVTADDYVELAVIEYQDKFHTDLANKTTLRGFVQIDVEASNGRTALAGSQKLALVDAQGHALSILATDANGKLIKSAAGKYLKVPALAVDAPHYLGPVLNATSGVPMRVKLHNLLPSGRAVVTGAGAAAVVGQRNGDHFLPFDTTILGAGVGPDGVTSYTQNRVNFHVQGADAPWISAGSPHQWFTPADEADASVPGSLAATIAADPARDPAYLDSYLRGASTMAVPDMNDPGPGAMTYYFANNQGARLLWANDKTLGQGRLNTYAGMALPYVVTDAAERAMVANGTLPPAERTLPLVLQDRTFVPKDIALQDGKWNTSAWGAESSLWYPHVYEPVQDSAQLNNWNAVGRWYYGPLFWPIFPAAYTLPSGDYSAPSFTPEAFFDTPVVNGVAYPTTEVEPTTYRLRIVNASNDRWMTFNLFEGKVTAQLADGTTVKNAVTDAAGKPIASEVDMVQATLPNAASACADPDQVRPDVNSLGVPTAICTPATWPIDSRAGGVAAPSAVGPSLHQFANEAGLLINVATINPTPILYIMDKGRITVLNPDTPALFLSPGDHADVVVDFSQYAGKSLLAYNDAGGPEPGADPRNSYFTGDVDQSSSGGAETTKPGYGPNSRTLMQFKVKATKADGSTPTLADAFDPASLSAAVTAAYIDPLAGQERPVVAQADYQAFDTSWATIPAGPAADGTATAYASIYTSTLKEPSFQFVPGTPSASFNSIKVTAKGSGYVTAPAVKITGTGSGASAAASLKISALPLSSAGSGYTTAPTITIGTPTNGGGSGAFANALLAPNAVTVSNGGLGYTSAPAVKFSVQPGAVAPVATATVVAGKVTAVTVTTAGSGYSVAPAVTFVGGGATTPAKATSSAAIERLVLIPAYPVTPASIGGAGYTDLSSVAVQFSGGGGTGAAATATGEVFDISVIDFGTGYTAPPTVSVAASPSGAMATAEVDLLNGPAVGKMLAKAKSIQELFEPSFGRYNSTQGVELPFTTAFTQTTIPLGYVDTPTEFVKEGETQIWKYVHNGLFGQPVEFNGFNVQVVNRVGWDGFVVPPLPNELGWKTVLRVNPLEDAIIALRPKKSKLPGFAVPTSIRPMDPTQPLGSPFGFTQFDPATGLAAPIVNDIVDYRWENNIGNTMASRSAVDFNRPVTLGANEWAPLAPTGVTVTSDANGLKVQWTDATPAANGDNPQAEVGFRVQVGQEGSAVWKDLPADLRAVNGMAGQINTLANATEYVDSSVQVLPPPSAPNAPTRSGNAAPRVLTIAWTLPAVTNPNAGPSSITALRVLRAQVANNGIALSPFVDLGVSLAATAKTFQDSSVEPGTRYVYEVVAYGSGSANVIYRVVAVNTMGETASAASAVPATPTTGASQPATSAPSGVIATTIAAPTLPAPSLVLSLVGGVSHAIFSWNPVDGAVAYGVRYRIGSTANNGNWTNWVNQPGTSADVVVGPNQFISFQVRAASASAIVSTSASSPTVQHKAPAAPTGLATSAVTTSSMTLSWTGIAGATYAVSGGVAPVTTAATSASLTGLTANTAYTLSVVATNGLGSSAASTPTTRWTLANPVTAAPTVANPTATTLTVNWLAPVGGATSFVVQRATNANFTGAVNTPVAGNLTTLDVTGLAGHTTYFFRVVAVNGAGVQTLASPAVTQLTLPAVPTGVAAVTSPNGAPVTGILRWTSVNGLTYDVQWSDAAAMTGATLVSPATSNAQIAVNGVARNVFMQVRAVNATGVGAWSAVTPVAAR
ncbi:MAG: fibronectin type III domain-containing protein [Leptothrix sp. (in: b-proteobacteria)]